MVEGRKLAEEELNKNKNGLKVSINISIFHPWNVLNNSRILS